MAEGLEYLTQFIDPNIRQRFGPAVQGIARLFAPTPYTSTATKDLLTSTANINKTGIKPIIDSTGRFLTTGVTQALEANPAFRPIVKGAKLASNLAEEAIEATTKRFPIQMGGPEKKLIKGVNDTAEDIFDEIDQNIIDEIDIVSGFKDANKTPSYATPEKKKLTLKLLKIAENDKSNEAFGVKFQNAYKNYVLDVLDGWRPPLGLQVIEGGKE